MILVESISHLKELATNKNGDFVDFFIILSGFSRSSKRIIYYPDCDEFSIINEIDESYQEVATKDLVSKTILLKAIDNKCMFMYVY